MRRLRRGALGAGLLGCALLTGCVSIPGDGPVMPAGKVVNDRPRVQYRAADPSPEDGPAETVRQFIEAAKDFVGDHLVARKYLQSGVGPRLSWRPESPVMVYSGLEDVTLESGPGVTPPLVAARQPGVPRPPSPTPSSSPASASSGGTPSAAPTPTPEVGDVASVTAAVTVVARIDPSGRYSIVRNQRVTRSFELTYTTEGWRISTLENGLLLPHAWLRQVYRSMPLYFPDPQGDYLVPDVRWFPVDPPSTPSAVVATLLDGPAAWLQPGVEVVVPHGTHPTVNGVKVADGEAVVDLSREVRKADDRQRRVLKRQLDVTLTGPQSVVGAAGVQVTVEQQVLELAPTRPPGADVPGAAEVSAPRPPPDDVDTPVGLDAKGALVQLLGRDQRPIAGVAALTSPTNSFPAVEAGGAGYAVLSADRSKLQYATPNTPVRSLLTGRALSPPSIDPYGWVWTAQDQAGGRVWTARPGGRTLAMPVDWLGASRVRALRVSREGARAVLVMVPPGQAPQVVVCAVVRDAVGRPIALGPPERLLDDADDVTSATWMDPTHVVVLARRPGQPEQMPWIVEIGGDVEPTIPAPGAVAVTVDPQQQLWVVMANGAVQHRSVSSWEAVPGVRYAALPG